MAVKQEPLSYVPIDYEIPGEVVKRHTHDVVFVRLPDGSVMEINPVIGKPVEGVFMKGRKVVRIKYVNED